MSEAKWSVELLTEPFLHDIPGVTGAGSGFEIVQSISQDFPVPVGNRNRLWGGRNSVPQRLQVVDLLVDRQLVETGGAGGERGLAREHIQSDDVAQYTARPWALFLSEAAMSS